MPSRILARGKHPGRSHDGIQWGREREEGRSAQVIRAYRISTGTHRRYRLEDVAALLIEQDRFRGTDAEE